VTSNPILPTRHQTNSSRSINTSTQGSNLADILERVLDKGVVIAGDISISIASTELIHIRIRLLISSVDKAKEIGINWWENDPYLSSKAQRLVEENQELQHRLESLEAQIKLLQSATVPEQPPLTSNTEDDMDENQPEVMVIPELTPLTSNTEDDMDENQPEVMVIPELTPLASNTENDMDENHPEITTPLDTQIDG
jgi:hypothetical protein